MPQLTVRAALQQLAAVLVAHGPDTPLWVLTRPEPGADPLTRHALGATVRASLTSGGRLCDVVRTLRQTGYLPGARTMAPCTGLARTTSAGTPAVLVLGAGAALETPQNPAPLPEGEAVPYTGGDIWVP
jgi:hypothetical protein